MVLAACESEECVKALGAIALLSSWRRQEHIRTLMLVPLLLLQIGYVKIGFNRADSIHLAWAMIPSFLLLSLCLDEVFIVLRSGSGPRGLRMQFLNNEVVGGIAVCACFLCAYCIKSFGHDEKWTANWADSWHALAEPYKDDAMISPTIRPIIDVLRSDPSSCTYVLTNEGMLYFWSGKRACSRFAYPAYIAPAFQSEVIADLANHDPGIVVFDSSFWSARIDGRSLPQRTPQLANWIERRYDFVMYLNGYELRARQMLPGFVRSQWQSR